MEQTAKDRFNTICTHRMVEGKGEYGSTWQSRHPLWETLEEIADAVNYLKVARANGVQVSNDLLLTTQALGATVMSYVQKIEELGMDPQAPWKGIRPSGEALRS